DYEQLLPRLDLDQRQVPIVVRLPEEATRDLDLLRQLTVPGARGPVPLREVATLEIASGPAQIDRLDRRRNVNFEIELDGGAPAGGAGGRGGAAVGRGGGAGGRVGGGPGGRRRSTASTGGATSTSRSSSTGRRWARCSGAWRNCRAWRDCRPASPAPTSARPRLRTRAAAASCWRWAPAWPASTWCWCCCSAPGCSR